ncbi:hypothetical protein GCK32_021514, partial [Trichostrongylus colubriformis]
MGTGQSFLVRLIAGEWWRLLMIYCMFQRSRSGSITNASPESIDRTPSFVSANSSSSFLSVPAPIRKRSGSMPAFKLSTLAIFWNLKKEQVRALRMTWARLCEPPRSNCKGIVNLVERVWEKLDT